MRSVGRPILMGEGLGRAEPDEIDELEDADRVEHEQADKPFFLAVTCRMPEGEPFDGDTPDREDKDKRGEEYEERHERDHRRGVPG